MWIKCQNKKLINTDYFREFIVSTTETTNGLFVKIAAIREWIFNCETATETYEVLKYENDKETAERVLNGIYEDILHGLKSDKPCAIDINEMILLYEKNERWVI